MPLDEGIEYRPLKHYAGIQVLQTNDFSNMDHSKMSSRAYHGPAILLKVVIYIKLGIWLPAKTSE